MQMNENERTIQGTEEFDTINGVNFLAHAENTLSSSPILSAQDVEVQFTLRGKKLTAIRKCSLTLYEGETLAIVGESGSGKSVFTKCFVGMLDKNGSVTGGSIMYDGVDLAGRYSRPALGLCPSD